MLISIVAILFPFAQNPHQHLLLFLLVFVCLLACFVFKDGHSGWDETVSKTIFSYSYWVLYFITRELTVCSFHLSIHRSYWVFWYLVFSPLYILDINNLSCI